MDNKSSMNTVSTMGEEPLTADGSACAACTISAAFFTIMYAVAAIAYPPMAIPPALMACVTLGALRCAPGSKEL